MFTKKKDNQRQPGSKATVAKDQRAGDDGDDAILGVFNDARCEDTGYLAPETHHCHHCMLALGTHSLHQPVQVEGDAGDKPDVLQQIEGSEKDYHRWEHHGDDSAGANDETIHQGADYPPRGIQVYQEIFHSFGQPAEGCSQHVRRNVGPLNCDPQDNRKHGQHDRPGPEPVSDDTVHLLGQALFHRPQTVDRPGCTTRSANS